ncbi:MAG: ATP-binding protein, partial [Candidatus Eremiobacterota bacterium]
PVACRTPHQDRVASAPLLKLSEPGVMRAWRDGQMVYMTEEPTESRVFVGEKFSLCLPLEGEGVLYVGTRSPEGFSDEERDMLGVIAAQGVVAIQSARRLESEHAALEQHRRARERLESWVKRLAFLLEGTGRITATLDAEVLAEGVEELLSGVVPQEFGAFLVCDEEGPLRALRCWGSTDVGAALALGERVRANARPLLLEEAESTRVGQIAPGQESLLAVPLLTETGCIGVLLAGSPKKKAYRRDEQDLIQLIGYLTTAAFSSQDTHQKLLDTQTLLAQSSKMAAVGQLAAGVAHELNTPLAAMLIAAEGALEKLPDRPDLASKRLLKIQSAGRHAQQIVSNLLIYCQGSTGGTEDVQLDRVVENTLALLSDQFQRDGVQVRTQLTPVGPVKGSPVQLQQVLTNLLNNARDAMRQTESPTVLIRLFQEDGAVTLSVSDSGPGVPPEVADRIFEPFFTTKEVGHGTGLGLSVCHQIVTQHGGTLELDRSAPGARFVMRLPRP